MEHRGGLRKSLSLDGMWKFAVDPSNVGEQDNWHLTDFDDSNWDDVQVPPVWEACGYVDYDGVRWYRKKFDLTPGFTRGRIYLEFLAVNYFAKVCLDGKSAEVA